MKLKTNQFLIAFDLDDVLWNFNQAFLDWFNQKFNKRIRFYDLKNYMLSDALGLTDDETAEVIWQFCHSLAHDQIMATKKAYDFLSFIVGHEYCSLPISVTSRPEELKALTECLFQKLFPDIKFSFMKMLGSYHSNDTVISVCKSDVCREFGAHLVFEDSFSNAVKIAGKGIPVILFNKPWNIECDDGSYALITRTDGFSNEVWRIFHYYRVCYIDGHYNADNLIPYNLHMKQVGG